MLQVVLAPYWLERTPSSHWEKAQAGRSEELAESWRARVEDGSRDTIVNDEIQ